VDGVDREAAGRSDRERLLESFRSIEVEVEALLLVEAAAAEVEAAGADDDADGAGFEILEQEDSVVRVEVELALFASRTFDRLDADPGAGHLRATRIAELERERGARAVVLQVERDNALRGIVREHERRGLVFDVVAVGHRLVLEAAAADENE